MKRRQKEIEEQAIERRKKMYGCDGKCYCDSIWDEDLKCYVQGGICGGIDTCDETRVGEFIGSIMAVLFVIGVPAAIIAAMVFFIISGIGG